MFRTGRLIYDRIQGYRLELVGRSKCRRKAAHVTAVEPAGGMCSVMKSFRDLLTIGLKKPLTSACRDLVMDAVAAY